MSLSFVKQPGQIRKKLCEYCDLEIYGSGEYLDFIRGTSLYDHLFTDEHHEN